MGNPIGLFPNYWGPRTLAQGFATGSLAARRDAFTILNTFQAGLELSGWKHGRLYLMVVAYHRALAFRQMAAVQKLGLAIAHELQQRARRLDKILAHLSFPPRAKVDRFADFEPIHVGALLARETRMEVEAQTSTTSPALRRAIRRSRIPRLQAVGTNGLNATGNSQRYTLRNYQEEAAHNVLAAIKAGKSNGLIVLPTGTGKTVNFVEIAKRIDEQQLLGADKKVLVLVHRVELVDQAKAAFERVFGGGLVSVVSAGRDSREFSGKVVVAGVQTLVTARTLDELKPEEYGLVIVDETHHIVANTWRRILQKLGVINEEGFGIRADGKFLLGVTATPDRADKVHLGITFTDGLLFSKPLAWFVHQGYLLRPEGVLVQTEAKLSEVGTGKDGDYIEAKLAEAMSEDSVLAAVVKSYHDICEGKKTLIFASSVGHAHALAEKFNEGGIVQAKVIDGTMPSDLRDGLIHAHKQGEFPILINYGILTEGYDDPGIEAILIARPTRSRALYVQMVGRALRPDPEHPDRKIAVIVDITGDMVKHDLDMDLAKMFGIMYTDTGLPPLDVVAVAEQYKDFLQDTDLQARAKRNMLILGDEYEYVRVALVRGLMHPMTGFINEVLTVKYDSDISKMAWELGMTEARLTDYISGYLPEQERRLKIDFARAETVLGVSVARMVELWKDSLLDKNLTVLLNVIRKLDSEQPDLRLIDFFPALALEWSLASLGVTEDYVLGSFKYQLWEWERGGVDISAIDTILDRHDHDVYKRSQAKRDLQTLTELARTTAFSDGDELVQEARRRGLIPTLPQSLDWDSFVSYCQRRGLYTDELARQLQRNIRERYRLRDPQRFYDIVRKFNHQDRPAEMGLPEFYLAEMGGEPADFSTHLMQYLASNHPAASKSEILTIAIREEVAPRIPNRYYHQPWERLLADNSEVTLIKLLGYLKILPTPETLDLFRVSFFSGLVRRKGNSLFRSESLIDFLRRSLAMSEEESAKPLGPSSHLLPKSEELRGWGAKRLGSTVENLDRWGKLVDRYYGVMLLKPEGDDHIGIDTFSTEFYLWFVSDHLSYLIDQLHQKYKGQIVYYEDFMKELSAITGLAPQDVETWLAHWPYRKIKPSLPQKRPTSQTEQWLSVIQRARTRWSRIDGLRDRQRKLREGCAAEGLDLDQVIQTAAGWEQKSGPEATLRSILFDKPPTGAGFRMSKSK